MIPNQPDYIVYGVLLIALVFARIPKIGKYFRVIDTLFHESGHALAALFTSGTVMKIELFQDTSGATYTQTKNWFSDFIISISGYPFASGMSYLLFYLIHTEKYNWVFILLVIFVLLNLALWVRNMYGIIWLISFGGILFAINYFKNEQAIFCFTLFISATLLFDSIIKCFQLVYISIQTPQKSGDATNLKKQTFIPAFIWAVLFLAVSIYFAYRTVFLFL